MIGLQKVFVFFRLNGTKPWPDEFWKTRFTVTKITDSIKANVNRLKCVECLTSSLPWLQTIYWKKVSVIAFRNIAPKILPVVHISSLIFTTYLKKFIGIKSISTKQCPAELSPWIIPPVSPILPKMFPFLSYCLLPFQCMDSPAHSPKPTVWGKPCRWKKNPVQSQKNAHLSHQQNPTHQIAIFM